MVISSVIATSYLTLPHPASLPSPTERGKGRCHVVTEGLGEVKNKNSPEHGARIRFTRFHPIYAKDL